MGIVQGILDASIEAATREGAVRITEIHISVGDLTEVVDFALQFAFDALTPETMAEGATLEVVHVPATSKCAECGTVFEHGRFEILCPECQSFMAESITGRELRIDSIEIDTPEDLEASATDDATGAEGDHDEPAAEGEQP